MKKKSGLCILLLALTFLSSNGLPQGGDPENGAELYAQKCAWCHGSNGEGDGGLPLRGCEICDSFGALSEKIEAEMPPDNPQDCVDTCAYDTAAFIFVHLNGHSEDNGGGCFIMLSVE
jgi:hypothetical protein